LAAEAIRAESRNAIKIGITLNLDPIYPATSSPRDIKAVKTVDTFLNRIVLDPLIKGTSPLDENKLVRTLVGNLIKPGDLQKIKTVDLLGVNYYTRLVVKHSSKVPIVKVEQVNPEGNDYSGMWEIYPEGLYDLLKRIHTDYKPGCEMMVTENGVPVPDGVDFDGRIRDNRRIKYLQDHLFQVHRAIQDGIPVKGYFHWSFMDNFEWALGYAQRFGLVFVDYPTQKRIVKDSGDWFSDVIRTNGFDI
jgi:beta-glucosidase